MPRRVAAAGLDLAPSPYLRLADEARGWRARPRADARGEPTGMPMSFPRLGLGQAVYPTHRYRITSSYFNRTNHTIPDDGMAKVGGIFAPSDPLSPVDVREARYQADLRYLLGLRCGAERMMPMLAHVQRGE